MESEIFICSGRGCRAVSTGTLHHLKRIPDWRKPDDSPLHCAQFDLAATIHYCTEHEQIAKEERDVFNASQRLLV